MAVSVESRSNRGGLPGGYCSFCGEPGLIEDDSFVEIAFNVESQL